MAAETQETFAAITIPFGSILSRFEARLKDLFQRVDTQIRRSESRVPASRSLNSHPRTYNQLQAIMTIDLR